MKAVFFPEDSIHSGISLQKGALVVSYGFSSSALSYRLSDSVIQCTEFYGSDGTISDQKITFIGESVESNSMY